MKTRMNNTKGEIKIVVVETDTGDVFTCPVCKEKFHLYHIRGETPVKTKKPANEGPKLGERIEKLEGE